MCAMVLEPPEGLVTCAHADVEVLGYDRNTEFLRCRGCGQVFVRQGGRFWTIRRTE